MAAGAYEEVLASLYRLEAAKGMDFKLERVARVLDHLGNPQHRFPTIHIAGTNGKGSVAAMVHAVLAAAGYRVGLYTSPHLVRFTERIRIGSDEIDEADVVALAHDVRAAGCRVGIELTFFEVVTAMAFAHFARQGVDVAVIEVGLGGRLDATNVITPLVSVITTVGFDHCEYLGNSLESIAREKAGIIKPSVPLVVGDLPSVAIAAIEELAAALDAPTFRLGIDFALGNDHVFRFPAADLIVDGLHVGLRGSHQISNAATALAALTLLRRRFSVANEAIRVGLAGVRWPGRLDVVSQHPFVILDGAHNVDGARMLQRELAAVAGQRRVHLLFAVMGDKDWTSMVRAIGPAVATVTVTTAPSPRAQPPAPIADAFDGYAPVRIIPDPMQALEDLMLTCGRDDAILVTGSLFLVGAVYPRFLGDAGGTGMAYAHRPVPHLQSQFR